MKIFNPNSASSSDSGIFGLPFTLDEASIVYLPVPWEVTTSYRGGASLGPQAVLKASYQVDLFDLDVLRPYESGLFFMKESSEVFSWNEQAKMEAQKVIQVGGEVNDHPHLQKALDIVNDFGEKLNGFVFKEALKLIELKKTLGVIGGDHSVSFGALQAISHYQKEFGVLHIDAHSDTRKAYEGFVWSHASIFYNVLTQLSSVKKLVQVGIRDLCEEELEFCSSQGERVKVFFDNQMSQNLFDGVSWKNICQQIISSLPQDVWISFDIDGLDPSFCPNTGTPVPGGLSFNQVVFLFRELVLSGRRIIGFDLTEVAPSQVPFQDLDANVGARLLYKLSGFTLASQGKTQIRTGFD